MSKRRYSRSPLPRRLPRNPLLLAVLLVAGLVAGLVQVSERSQPAQSAGGQMRPDEFRRVEHVVDGDTIRLEGGIKVRLIGLDTPEMHESDKLYRDVRRSGQDADTIRQAGTQSWRFTRGLLEGRRVRLEFDVQTKDRYGRWLAYVYLEDGTFANAEIIHNGFAGLMTIPPNVRHMEEFRRLLTEARDQGRGLWKAGQKYRIPLPKT